MAIRIRSPRDFAVGLVYIATGAAFSFASAQYEMGTPDHMGPGYFPFWLGIVLVLLGATIVLRTLRPNAGAAALAPWDWRLLLWTVGSVALFGAALKPLGLVLALLLLVMLSSLASREFTWRGALLNAVVLAALNLGVFVYGLDLPLPVWPSWAAG
ncbi:Tripartite tricarboxylate transporter TctB family protein [Pollutimonas bauzanensis]|uniref:Tripartite tricarboxylate transporter TctB family protein n=1 Tax=Pollutimonas bauzanensis TaxID=658167 RepID=A0A1M5NIA4_9BURK|nr:Tripartite tricarboxylate transporter TctB family protein [Pollutimonas bauzanensis]